MIRSVTFDWNGTLIADTRACMDADNHVIRTYGGRPVDLGEYRKTIIIPAVDFYVQHGCDRERLLADSKKLGEVFHEYYEPRASKCRSRKGARELLEYIKDNSIDSIVLSNHTVEGIEFQLRRLGLSDYISAVLANSERDASMKGRNKSEKLDRHMSDNDYKREEVLIVGDSPEEIEIGRGLGLKSVAITGGYYAGFRLIESKPDYLINSLTEMIDILRESRN